MKLHTVWVPVATILAACSMAASATPGGLNAAGCHNSKKLGYHCHRAQAPGKAAPPAPARPAKNAPSSK